MSLLQGHEIWEARFNQALTAARQAEPGSDEREQAIETIRKLLRCTRGEALYWIERGLRR